MKIRVMLALLVILGGTGVAARAQAGGGKAYDSRDPLVCRSKKDPARGAPSTAQLNDYVRCSNEKISGGYLSLFQNMQVEIGKSRPYNAWSDLGNPDIDNSEPVYPIRGSYDAYLCSPVGTMGAPAGGNCTVFKANDFAGICYKTTFADWNCPVHGTSAPFTGQEQNMPPPK